MSVVKIIADHLVIIIFGIACNLLAWFLIEQFITGGLRVENERLKNELQTHRTLLENDSKKIGVLSNELAVIKNDEYISIDAKDKREKESKIKAIENFKSEILKLPPVKLVAPFHRATDYMPLYIHNNPSSNLNMLNDMPKIMSALSAFCSNTYNIMLFTDAAGIYVENEKLRRNIGQFLGNAYSNCNVIMNYNEYSQLSRFGKFLARASGFIGTSFSEDTFTMFFNSMIRDVEKIMATLDETSKQLQQDKR